MAEVTDEAFSSFPAIGSPSPSVIQRKFLNSSDISHGGSSNKRMRQKRKSSLQVLHLAKSRITDKSMMKMAFLADLLEIHLQWCSGITDAGIAALVTGCLKLEIIDLKSCSITDLSIDIIAKGSRELRSLDVSWCSNVTDNGIRGLSLKDYHSGSTLAASILAARGTPIVVPEGTATGVTTGVTTGVPTGAVGGVGTTSAGVTEIAGIAGIPFGVVETGTGMVLEAVASVVPMNTVTAEAGDMGSQSSVNDDSNNNSVNSISAANSNSHSHSDNSSSSSRHLNDSILIDNEESHPSKLETLCVVWCLQLTDAALLSLAHLPKLMTIEATGCTGVSEESVQKLTASGIKLVI